MHFSAFRWFLIFILILFQFMIKRYCAYQTGVCVSNFNKCKKSESFLTKKVGISLQQCIQQCDYRQKCSGINYRRTVQLCELIPTTTTVDLEVNIIPDGPCTSVDKSDIIPSQNACACAEQEVCNPITGTCSVQECSQFVITNGQFSGNTNTIGAYVKFKCIPGFTDTKGESIAICLKSGNWSHEPECRRDCEDPTPANGKSSSNIFTYQTTLSISCGPGYVLSGPASITCLEDGTWSSKPTCEPKDCGDPTPSFGMSSSSTFLYQTALTISCDPGYVVFGPASITCQADGTWSSEPTCEPRECGDPTPANGKPSSTTFTYRKTLIISCDPGYLLSGPDSITCLEDGTWSSKPTCDPKDCGDPTPAYGKSSSATFTYRTTLTISCDPGYLLSGPASITCQEHGTWSSIPSCEPKDCEDPTPANGKSSSTTFSYQTTLTISCDPGYVLSGPTSIMCREDGTWSSKPTCEPKDCGDPKPENGKTSSDIFTYQTTLTILCDPGYVLSGPASITCREDGAWGSKPTCEQIECGDPTPAFGKSSSTTFTYQTTLTISCDPGYVLSGPASITCREDGTWSSKPTCEPKVKTLGSTCSSASDCNDVNAVCIFNICLCNFYSKYNTTVGECIQDCTSILNTFERHPDTYIVFYNSLGDTVDSNTVYTADECKQKCLDTPGCVAVEHTGHCYFSEISLQMMKAAQPDSIRTTEGFDMYVRECA